MGQKPCCGCGHKSDPTTDTVKVDPNAIKNGSRTEDAPSTDAPDVKEAALLSRSGCGASQQGEEQRMAEVASPRGGGSGAATPRAGGSGAATPKAEGSGAATPRSGEESRPHEENPDAERLRQEQEEARVRQEQERLEQEARQREEEERAEQQRKRREEEEERAEQERQRLETERLEQERRAGEQLVKDQENRQFAEKFLEDHGFPKDNVNAKKKKMMKTSYPLHVAVTDANARAVELLLWLGANPATKNSSGQTPLDLAQKLDKSGSHADVVRVLSAVPAP